MCPALAGCAARRAWRSWPHMSAGPKSPPARNGDTPWSNAKDEGERQGEHDERQRLRDFFAGQALAMLYGWHDKPKRAATIAYAIADAILAERGKPPI